MSKFLKVKKLDVSAKLLTIESNHTDKSMSAGQIVALETQRASSARKEEIIIDVEDLSDLMA
jgi:hypothetical protein